MIVLVLRTDKPESEIGLFDNDKELAYCRWQAHRELAETIHKKIKVIMEEQGLLLNNIQGIVVFRGPGSFTGLRIGLAVANSLSYSLDIPIVGTNNSETWVRDGIELLKESQNHQQIVPDYGAPVFTTSPKK